MAKSRHIKKKPIKRALHKLAKPSIVHAKYSKPRVEGKHIPLKIAGILFMIVGVISILSGLLVSVFANQTTGVLIAAGQSIMAPNLAMFILGITSISLGIVEFLMGYGIMRLQKWAGIISAIISVFSIVASIPYILLNPFGGSMSFMLSLIILVLLYVGWKELQGSW